MGEAKSMEVEVGTCRCGGYGVVFTEEIQRQTGRCHDPDMDHRNAMQMMQDDIAEALRALGLPDHARPKTPHAVMQDEVIPAITRLRADKPHHYVVLDEDSNRASWGNTVEEARRCLLLDGDTIHPVIIGPAIEPDPEAP